MSDPVVVVGASQAGLFAAELLARQGVPVHVYERAERLAPARRTLIVTADLVRTLGFTPHSAILSRVPRFEFRSGDEVARLELHEPDLMIERAALIHALAARAEYAGARLFFGHRFDGFELDGDRCVARMRHGERDQVLHVRPRAVVGADGTRSAVAAALGHPPRPTTTVIQARVALPPGADVRLAQVWFAPRETPYFYWLVPEADGTAMVGVVEDAPRAARSKLDRFVRDQGYEPLEHQAARIPMYQPSPIPHGRVGRTGVYLVGDAGGQVKVTTVGGTVSGLQGARVASQAVLREGGYRRALWPLHAELTVHWAVRRLWSRFGEDDYASLLRSMSGGLGRVLQAHSRDRWTGALMPVLAAQPALLALAVRTMARW